MSYVSIFVKDSRNINEVILLLASYISLGSLQYTILCKMAHCISVLYCPYIKTVGQYVEEIPKRFISNLNSLWSELCTRSFVVEPLLPIWAINLSNKKSRFLIFASQYALFMGALGCTAFHNGIQSCYFASLWSHCFYDVQPAWILNS